MISSSIQKLAACCATVLLAPALHAAQGDMAAHYPAKPIRFIVPYSPGAGTDTTARIIATKLAEKWNQQVVVDNRTGGGGTLGVDYTANANPDGYTICLISASHAAAEATGQKISYALGKDLQPVTQATSLFYVVYHSPSLPVKSIKELIAYAKANPGKLNFGTSGNGSLQHFAGELMNHMAGIKLVHVPYRGAANIIPSMLANEIQLGFNTLFGVRPQVQAGRLRWLAITAAQRSPAVDLPTVSESGLPGFEVNQWYGIVTAARVPKPIVTRLHAAIADSLQARDVVQRLSTDGSAVVASAPEQFGAHIKAEVGKWRRLVKEANLQFH